MAVLLVLVLLLVGCGSVHNVPVVAPAGYTPTQITADQEACAEARKGREHQDDFYSACMIAKGYTAYYTTVAIGGYRGKYMVRSTKTRLSDVVEADLRACEDVAKEKTEGIRTAAESLRWSLPIASLYPSIGARSEMSRYFSGCMESREYVVKQWDGERNQ